MSKISIPYIDFKMIGLILLFVVSVVSSVSIVSPGTVKVVTQFGKVTGRVMQPGLNFKVPFAESTLTYNTKKVIYEASTDIKQQGSKADYKDFPVDTNTKDGQRVEIFYTVRFSVNPSKASWVAQHVGSEDALVEKIVKTDSRIWSRAIPREYKAEDIYTGTGQQKVQIDIESKLRPIFKDNGLLLDEFGIREIKFTESYITAIETKQIEEVKIETEENKAEQAKFQKEQRITKAEGMAQEQELQRQTITADLLEKMAIEKWDGSMPTYWGGGPLPFLNIGN